MGSQIITIRVPQVGLADHRTVQEAVDAVPFNNTLQTVIRVAPGVYRQPVYVPKTKNLITLAAIGPEKTVLTFDNTASKIKHHQPLRLIGTKTFGCGTVIIEGEDFIAENITFENTAPQPPQVFLVIIRRRRFVLSLWCEIFFLVYDMLYLHYGKQYLRDCYIEGSVDFIFGDSAALFENCHVHCKSAGVVTAQKRSNESQPNTGYVFLRCAITGEGGTPYTYLGRPWGPLAKVIFAYSYMDTCVRPDGWSDWPGTQNHTTACFREYKCFGPGSSSSNRVTWAKQLADEKAVQFLAFADGFVDPDWQGPWLRIGSL